MLLFVAALGPTRPGRRPGGPRTCPDTMPDRSTELATATPEKPKQGRPRRRWTGKSIGSCEGSTLLSVPHLARPRRELGMRSNHADVPDLRREAEHSGPAGRNRFGRMELTT